MPRGIKPHLMSSEELKQVIDKAYERNFVGAFDVSGELHVDDHLASLIKEVKVIITAGDRSSVFAPSVYTPGSFEIVGNTATTSYTTYSNYKKYVNELNTPVLTKRQAGIFIENTIDLERYMHGDYKSRLIELVNSRLISNSETYGTSFRRGVLDGRHMGLQICTGIREFSNDHSSRPPDINLRADLTCVQDFRDTMKLVVEYYGLYKNNRTIKSIRRYFYGVYFALVQVAKATISMRVDNYDTLPLEVQDWVMLTLEGELKVAYKVESLIELLGRLYELYILSKTANMFPPTGE